MSKATILRFSLLILALINQFLANKGLSPIPVDEETISTIITTVIGLYVGYKDNPTSKEGKWANQKLQKYKAEKKYQKATGKAPVQINTDNNEGNL
ncbi:phage holin [Staphylococcus cohnii]|uniref:phage holin n=1 Tax=Staphylococcus cohnii TaxID=29382 RepID=UPI003D7ED81E